MIAHHSDNVGIALAAMTPGDETDAIVICDLIPAGHKFAVRPIAAGQPVIKLGHAIGRASVAIAIGQHVHSHNLAFVADSPANDAARHLIAPPRLDASFMGFQRADGRAGTRNFIGILTSVNCSATVAKRIAAHFSEALLSRFPNVDGVVAFSHMSGCGMAKDGPGLRNLQRTIAGYAGHPNFAGILLVGLGCEVNQIDPMLDAVGVAPSERLRTLTIQECGGTAAAIQAGIAAVTDMLPVANAAQRELLSARQLTIGLQCGASDGYSAITANPALGVAADRVVAAGGRVILSETPEIYGAESLLIRRAASDRVAAALIERINWWTSHAAHDGASLDNNPSPGNKAGGITTILEKSLGAVAKSGSTPLNDVIDYAETVTAPGLSFMDSPGFDPCSATGQIAAGANLILFTTGRGSIFGSLPAPTIKLASNAALVARMPDDIDIDCSPVLSGTSLDAMGSRIFDEMLAVASGRTTASERQAMGESEWVPWIPGAVY